MPILKKSLQNRPKLWITSAHHGDDFILPLGVLTVHNNSECLTVVISGIQNPILQYLSSIGAALPMQLSNGRYKEE